MIPYSSHQRRHENQNLSIKTEQKRNSSSPNFHRMYMQIYATWEAEQHERMRKMRPMIMKMRASNRYIYPDSINNCKYFCYCFSNEFVWYHLIVFGFVVVTTSLKIINANRNKFLCKSSHCFYLPFTTI